MKDMYDEAIDYLTQHPEQIGLAWSSPSKHVAGCLFKFVSDESNGGCLTMIHSAPSEFTGGKWHCEIVADDRIPDSSYDIRVKDLLVFAEWQRKIHGGVQVS